jgi:tRNA pseudouridine55 synthase
VLGVGGHLAALRRTRVGPFTVGESLLGPDLDVASIPDDAWLTPAQAAMRCVPSVEVDVIEAADVAHGKSIGRRIDDLTAIIGPSGTLLALYRPAGDRAVPETVFVDGEGQ